MGRNLNTMTCLVDVIKGKGVGVPGLKTEPLKARFKGVVETVRGVEVLCPPLVGSSRGPCPQYLRHSVFKLNAFGACVGYKADALLLQIEAGNARTVKPLTLTLSFVYLLVYFFFSLSCYVFVSSIYIVVCLSSLCLCLRHVSCVSLFNVSVLCM
jgi:hypothetical protein